MPDITLCTNDQCKVRKLCWRAVANPGYVQSYAYFSGDRQVEKPSDCDHFRDVPNYGEQEYEDMLISFYMDLYRRRKAEINENIGYKPTKADVEYLDNKQNDE